MPFSVTLIGLLRAGSKVSLTTRAAAASTASAPVLRIVKVYAICPFSATTVGFSALVMLKSAEVSAVTVSLALIGSVSPPPLTDAVFTMLPPVPGAA